MKRSKRPEPRRLVYEDPAFPGMATLHFKGGRAWIAWCEHEFHRTKETIFAREARLASRKMKKKIPEWIEQAVDLDDRRRLGDGGFGGFDGAHAERVEARSGRPPEVMLNLSRERFQAAVIAWTIDEFRTPYDPSNPAPQPWSPKHLPTAVREALRNLRKIAPAAMASPASATTGSAPPKRSKRPRR